MVATLDCTALMKDVLTDAVWKVRVKTTDAAYVEPVLDPDEPVLVLVPDEGVDDEPDDVELVPVLPPPAVLQAWVLHACVEAPEHCAPAPLGAGLVQLRVSVPPPHVAEQADQLVQTPSTEGT